MIIKKIKAFYSTFIFYGPLVTFKATYRYMIYFFFKHIIRKKRLKRRIYDYSMYIDLTTQGISKPLYLYGGREADHREILLRELGYGDRVLDIGSNIGYYPLMEAMIVGEEGKIFSCEPDPRNLTFLYANRELNGLENIIDIFNIAISNESGTKEFALHAKSNLNIMLSNISTIDKNAYNSTIIVKTVDIHELLQSLGKVDIIRMDIEGHEVEILKRISWLADNFPEITPKKIVFEAHPWKYDDSHHNMKKQLICLFDAGYHVKTISSSDEKMSSAIKECGYIPWKIVKSDLHERGIYNDIEDNDALKFICDLGCVRSVLLTYYDITK